jgi:hypothetical protein
VPSGPTGSLSGTIIGGDGKAFPPGLINENEEGFMSDTLSAATIRPVGYYEAADIGAKQYFVTNIPGVQPERVRRIFSLRGLLPLNAALSPPDAKSACRDADFAYLHSLSTAALNSSG